LHRYLLRYFAPTWLINLWSDYCNIPFLDSQTVRSRLGLRFTLTYAWFFFLFVCLFMFLFVFVCFCFCLKLIITIIFTISIWIYFSIWPLLTQISPTQHYIIWTNQICQIGYIRLNILSNLRIIINIEIIISTFCWVSGDTPHPSHIVKHNLSNIQFLMPLIMINS